MRTHLKFGAALLSAALLATATQAIAGDPLHTTNLGGFQTLGTTTQFTEFSSYPDGKITALGNSHVFGAVQVTGDNLKILGENTNPFFNLSSTLASLTRDELIFDISGYSNLLGVYTNNLYFVSDQSITIYTNLGSKEFILPSSISSEDNVFNGFAVPLGNYFTGFKFKAVDESTMPGIAGFSLGTSCEMRSCPPTGGGGSNTPPCDHIGGCTPTAVPEPTTWALIILGFGAIGSALRAARRRAGLRPA